MSGPIEPKSGTNRAPAPQPPREPDPPYPNGKFGLAAWVFGQVVKMRNDQLLTMALLFGFGYILFETLHKQNEQQALHQRQLEESRERDRQFYQELRRGDREVLQQLGMKIEQHSRILERIEAAMWGKKLPREAAPMPHEMD